MRFMLASLAIGCLVLNANAMNMMNQSDEKEDLSRYTDEKEETPGAEARRAHRPVHPLAVSMRAQIEREPRLFQEREIVAPRNLTKGEEVYMRRYDGAVFKFSFFMMYDNTYVFNRAEQVYNSPGIQVCKAYPRSTEIHRGGNVIEEKEDISRMFYFDARNRGSLNRETGVTRYVGFEWVIPRSETTNRLEVQDAGHREHYQDLQGRGMPIPDTRTDRFGTNLAQANPARWIPVTSQNMAWCGSDLDLDDPPQEPICIHVRRYAERHG